MQYYAPYVVILILQNGGTALGFATYSGKIDVIQILLEHEAAVNVKDTVSYNKQRRFMTHKVLISMFLQCGCTPMHIVGETGNTEIAELLISYGAQIDLPNEVHT